MKKRLVTVLLIIAILAPLTAARQKLYDADDVEYTTVKQLTQLAGVVGPSSALPVNAEELILALDRIDRSTLDYGFRTIYDQLYGELYRSNTEDFSFNIPVNISPQFFLTENYQRSRNEFFISYRDEEPLVGIGLETSFRDLLFMETEMPLMNSPADTFIPGSSFGWIINFTDSTLNFFGSKGAAIYSLMPTIARGSIGNDIASLVIGRTRHSMGNGKTANLVVGDNFSYQEVLTLKVTTNNFTYNVDVTHFDTQASDGVVENPHFDGRQQNRVIHRFDFNLWNKVRVVLNLGTLYYTSSSFDFRWFIPFMISHNYYNYSEQLQLHAFDEANNIMSIEIEYPFTRRFTLSAQAVLDQFELPSEKKKPDDKRVPNALGAMITFSYIHPMEEATLELFAEGIYTTPYLYLTYKESEDGERNYNYDYYFGYFRIKDKELSPVLQADNLAYSGFTPDTISAVLGATYTDFKRGLSSRTILKYTVQGEAAWNMSKDNFLAENFRGKHTPTGTAQHRIELAEYLSWQLNPRLKIYGALDFSYYINYKHGKDNYFDPQAYFGVTLRIL